MINYNEAFNSARLVPGAHKYISDWKKKPKYKVVKKENDIEIRSYDKILTSSVKVYGNQYNALRKGFQPLVKIYWC